jgi:hypothetical protein
VACGLCGFELAWPGLGRWGAIVDGESSDGIVLFARPALLVELGVSRATCSFAPNFKRMLCSRLVLVRCSRDVVDY